MNALGQSLAFAFVLHNISVVTVAPGWVDTDMAAETLASPPGESVRNQSPLKRIASPADVAAVVVFYAIGRGFLLDRRGR